jgi:hypothetical protein
MSRGKGDQSFMLKKGKTISSAEKEKEEDP